MAEDKKSNAFALFLFIIFVLLNWAYVIVVQYTPEITINSWFVLFPFISVLYFLFSLVAATCLYLNYQAGFTFAYISIMFGTLSSALSYSLIYKTFPTLEFIFPYLLILNLCFVGYLVFYSRNKSNNNN